MKRALTIRDIAKLSGFSRSTVSLVLNNNPRISQDTRKKIRRIMKQVGYQPNITARRLAERRSRMIGVIVPQTSHVFSDYYFSEAISGISDVLVQSEYKLMLQVVTPEFKEKKVYLSLFEERYIDGMLLLGMLTDEPMVRHLQKKRYPILLVNSAMNGVSSVVADNILGVKLAAEHLIKLGHQKFGLIKGLENTNTGIDRITGFMKVLNHHRLVINPKWIVAGNYSEESGYLGMKQILANRLVPTAVFAGNDMMAIGAIRAIREYGLQVPDDIAIVGGDDIKLAAYIEPPLTTIRQDMYEIGALAARELITLIHTHHTRARSTRMKKEQLPHAGTPHMVKTELIIRKSCGAHYGP
ncbi:MAG: LacI family DNA-binding transcriptional regulator [bacterium]|nr:LacI family DNA-binding transcriptional regulator [bacterium]